MREKPPEELENLRVVTGQLASPRGVMFGMFMAPDGLKIISSGPADHLEARGWEHVSVSRPLRIPSWEDMDRVKRLFWDDEETVLQFHPKDSERKNLHKNVLHLWKQRGVDYELPPRILV